MEVQERSGGKEVVAPPPSSVLELFRDRQVQELTETVETVAADLEELHDREERFEDFVTMVDTRESALRYMRQVIDSAEWWLTLAVSLETYDTLVEHVRDAVDRGVTVLLVVHRNGTGSVAGAEFPDGLEVRTRPLADTVALADRRYGVFSSQSPHKDGESYIVTQDTNLVFLFQNYFHNFWTGSETIQSDGEFPGGTSIRGGRSSTSATNPTRARTSTPRSRGTTTSCAGRVGGRVPSSTTNSRCRSPRITPSSSRRRPRCSSRSMARSRRSAAGRRRWRTSPPTGSKSIG